MRALVYAAVACLAGNPAVVAHQDPLGDVHPSIVVHSLQFVVTSTNNIGSTGTTVNTLTQVFDRAGAKVSESRRTSAAPPPKPFPDYSFLASLPEEQNGLERRTSDGWMIIPEWERKHGGKPYIITEQGGKFAFRALNWAKANVSQIVDCVVGVEELALLVTRLDASNQSELWLHTFSLATLNEKMSFRLPKPCMIWSFPVCSNMIAKDGVLHVAMVQEGKWGYELAFVSWNAATGGNRTSVLSSRIDWNTSLALAHIDNDALIAYHHPGAVSPFWPWKRDASIRTIHTKLTIP